MSKKRTRINLTQEIVRELLKYEPETGKLFWRERDEKWFKSLRDCNAWNTLYANKEAFTAYQPLGYRQGRIFRKLYQAHRVIWFMKTGEWPDQIDHINGVCDDNRWVNLRNVDPQENSKNRKLYKSNTSGYVGINWNKRRQLWRAEIGINKRNKHLGYFENIDDAIAARKVAEIQYGYHENHGRLT